MGEEYKRLLEEIRDAYFLIQNEKIVMVSNYLAEYWGYSKDELIDMPFIEIVAPEERERLTEISNKRKEGQPVPGRYESLFLSKDGVRLPVEVSGWLTSYQGQPATAGIAMDISERRHMLEKLQDSEEKYRSIVENSPDIIYTADPEGIIHSVNGAIKNILGYEPDDIIGRNFMDLIPEQAMPKIVEDHNTIVDGNKVTSETLTISKDGKERHLEFRTVPFFKDDRVVMAQGIIRDITDDKKAEEKLNRMFESMTDGIIVTNMESIITEVNERTVEMLGYASKDELLRKSCFKLIAQLDRDRALNDMSTIMEQGLLRNIEYTLIRRDGSEFCGELSSSVLKDAFGKPEGFIAIIRDITERKRAEIALRESEELFSKVFNYNPTAMSISTYPEGRVLHANDSLLRLVGYPRAEVIGHTSVDIKIFNEIAERNQVVQSLIDDQEDTGRELTIKTKTGRLLTVLSWAKQITINEEPHLISMALDITERKQMEEKYRHLVEEMNDGYGVIQDGKYVLVNRSFCDIFNYEPEQLLGESMDQLILPEDRQARKGEYDRVVRGDEAPVDQFEGEAIKADGGIIIVEASIKAIQFEGKPAFGIIIRDVTERRMAEEALRESSEMLRLMFECAPYGVIVLDLKNTILDVNDQTLKLCGVSSKEELIGKDGLMFIDPSYKAEIVQHHDKCVDEGLILGIEHPLTQADGNNIDVETSAGVLKNIDGNPIGIIAVSRDITYEKQLRDNKQFYITEIIKAQENERRNLARALHDDTVQELLLATHRLQDAIAGNQGRLPKRALRHLEEVKALIERTMIEVRGFTSDLRPGVLDDMGLIPALRWLLKRLSEGEGIDARLKTLGRERRLPSETELTLFRIAQESLSNVRKHASASSARITLEFNEDKVTMSVNDNGRGFELPNIVSQFTREHKLGLTGIAERVRLIGGRYKLESSPGKGTTIRVEIDG